MSWFEAQLLNGFEYDIYAMANLAKISTVLRQN